MADTITRKRILQIRELARTGRGEVPFTASEMRAMCELALMAVPLPGTVTIPPTEIREAIERAMQDAWDGICADTGCHPLDILRTKGTRLSFTANHWARAVADLLKARFADESEAGHG